MSTAKEKKYARDYYAKNRKYRQKKIADTIKKHKANKKEYNKKMREYYAKNSNYRSYKRKYANDYNKKKRA